MLLQAVLGRRGDRLELGDEPRGRLAGPPALARHGLRALGEAGQMRGSCRVRAAARRRAGGRARAGAAAARSRSRPRARWPRRAWRQAAGLIDDRAPFLEARILVPVGIIDERIRSPAVAAAGAVAGEGPSARAMAASTEANTSENSSSSAIGGSNASSSPSTGSASSTSACVRRPPLPSPAAPRGRRPTTPSRARRRRYGGARAARRALGSARGWASRTSISASCSTRSSRCTSSPSSQSAAQASTKWVLAIQPSRIGLVRSRSSSRASASSARASGSAISGQGSGREFSARSVGVMDVGPSEAKIGHEGLRRIFAAQDRNHQMDQSVGWVAAEIARQKPGVDFRLSAAN